ncbi:PREDICTED: putative F-box protein At3g16210 [Erythranthe guttata]|uniref:putative F-box protein At3g16210 n=1 Tax=Erythranthe guttata TaxID=4155 RepID=UPI00064E13D8|nr:PREDICTED: putative F-box protein At3g16210 [Erythranthe guttata]|eukprot:XP_012843206.1 PREDICTED: putative F-box protein At3g16210 [Erythranthe guttata]
MDAKQEKPVDLPADMIEFILSKLPVKSLLRFKSVCKSWNTIISDPVFIRNHRHLSMFSNVQNLFLAKISLGYHNFFSLVKLEGRKFITVEKIKGPDQWNTILCVCDGVLLLSDFWYRNFTLWNPSKRTETKFSSPIEFESRLNFGLCHNPITGDFKAVIVYRSHYLVFSTRDKDIVNVREFDDQTTHGSSELMNFCGVCADGVVYWAMQRDNCTEIVYFDPRDDEFRVLEKPEYLKDDDRSFHLTIWKGFLCLYRNGEDETRVEIWAKEKGCGNSTNNWMNVITIENVEKPISCFKPQCFVENKVLIVSKRSMSLYSPWAKTFELVDDADLACVDVMVPFPESI